jgi:hypothetical protein
MRKVTLFLIFLGLLAWIYNFFRGVQTTLSLSAAGADQLSMVVLPFLMPLVGLSLSALFTPWLLRIQRPKIALGLSGFSLLAGLLVMWVAGATSAG